METGFELNGDYWSGLAQDRYEARQIAEARRIVSGELMQTPTVEHVRILLVWLDGSDDTLPVKPF
jgi:hypothetical protein